MRRQTLAILLALGIVTSAAAADSVAARREAIPARFVGLWSSTLELCAKPEEDTTALKITPDSVLFWEDGGHALSVVTRGESELVVVLEMGSEEQPSYLDAIRFVLSKDKSHLSIMTGLKVYSTRVRCPKNVPQ